MPKTFVPNWNDDLIRPPNSDTQIGWAGVPLKDTLGYYGVIKRAIIPTNEFLGLDPDYDSVDADVIAKAFTAKIGAAFEKQNANEFKDLLHEDSHWKDVYLLTWDTRSLRGHEHILPMLEARLSITGIKNVQINYDAKPTVEKLGEDLAFVLFHIKFDFAHGTGVGVIRLSPFGVKTGSADELADVAIWKVFSMGTSVETIDGWDPEYGDKVRYQKGKVHDPTGQARSYAELRAAEANGEDGFDPTVIIVGAGHCGVTMAARLKVLGIPHLIVEREGRVGHSWANRYKSLSLHAPTYTNHLPCVPFPDWFPVFLPAQQLAEFLVHYAAMMDLNVWTNSSIDGKAATFDEATGRWTVKVTRNHDDGATTEHTFHPKHIMLATGISGTLPNIPTYPGAEAFEKNGGILVHSSRHRTGPDWKGKKCIVVGAATSAHDICYELKEHGCDVSMVQRSGTHIMSVEKGIRYFYRNRERTNRPDGPRIEMADQSNFLRHTFDVEYELLARAQQKAREIDHDLLESIKKVGYKLHDGYHGGGAYSLVFFDYGRYYWDTGCLQYIANKEVDLIHSEIDHFTDKGVVFKDGTSKEADVVVFATGYLNSKSSIQTVMGDEMASKCGERWEKGNAFFIGPEGDSTILYRPLPQRGLWSMFHQFSFNRFFSYRLALRIKAEELGIDVTPYGNRPQGPPSVEAGRNRRPDGVPF
ncbi:hypothetical protein SEUCBS140593_005424 [Sporothrix eucalyptigena]|uniref:Flavin-containing monooxygenase n=1 Tax=Sporothrix eucalyptigena TaxID=1812306 RepID=A0ABP0BX03_9PEZI